MRTFAVVCLALLSASIAGFAQPAPEKPTPDARFGTWLYKAPDPAVWQRAERAGALVFSVDMPPGDFCMITLFPGAPAEADFAQQFEAAVAEDQKAKDTVEIEADSGAQASKSTEGFDMLTRRLRCETSELHTFHIYIAGQSGDRFDLAAFQTTSEETWKTYGAQAAAFLRSLKLANSLPPEEVAKLVGTAPAKTAAAPALPGFDDAPASQPASRAPAAALAPDTTPTVPLEKSPIVANNAVTKKDGTPINGTKLSQHDTEIASPAIAVASDGTIHAVFLEKHRKTFAVSVYHRASSDRGKTWSEAKNLSEDMPGFGAGRCVAIADPRGRVYVIWRTGLREISTPNPDPWGGSAHSNLVYRVLEAGKWSTIKPVHPPGSPEKQNNGSLSFFATIDVAGRAQVLWNTNPGVWHPELTKINDNGYQQFLSGVGGGLVFQVTLDGTSASAPREVFLTEVGGLGEQGGYGTHCDGLDTINGYVDAAGEAHFVARITRTYDDTLRNKSRYQLCEHGKAGAFIDLPDLSFHGWRDIPTLLVDAKGRRHVITLYPAGERPGVRDYLIGSDEEPAVIRAAAAVNGTVDGMQAFQGPGGRMIVVMQMNDTGEKASGDTFVSMSTGDGWSTPINVTNNAGRRSFASRQTSRESHIAIEKSYYPGPAAAALDREGHLLLLMINNEHGLFGSAAFGVSLGGDSSSTPTLQFLRF